MNYCMEIRKESLKDNVLDLRGKLFFINNMFKKYPGLYKGLDTNRAEEFLCFTLILLIFNLKLSFIVMQTRFMSCLPAPSRIFFFFFFANEYP